MITLTIEQSERLSALYVECGLALDCLPYTNQFERLYAAFTAENYVTVTRNDVWHVLTYLRKRGRLPRQGRGRMT